MENPPLLHLGSVRVESEDSSRTLARFPLHLHLDS